MNLDANITLRISKEALAKLDDIRRAEPDVPGRAEMIRRLIEAEITAREEYARAMEIIKRPKRPNDKMRKAVADYRAARGDIAEDLERQAASK